MSTVLDVKNALFAARRDILFFGATREVMERYDQYSRRISRLVACGAPDDTELGKPAQALLNEIRAWSKGILR